MLAARDLLYGLILFLLAFGVGNLAKKKAPSESLRVIAYGPLQVSQEYKNSDKEFDIWMEVRGITLSSRILADGVPLISVVSEKDRAITAAVFRHLLTNNTSAPLKIQVIDKPNGRKSNIVEIQR